MNKKKMAVAVSIILVLIAVAVVIVCLSLGSFDKTPGNEVSVSDELSFANEKKDSFSSANSSEDGSSENTFDKDPSSAEIDNQMNDYTAQTESISPSEIDSLFASAANDDIVSLDSDKATEFSNDSDSEVVSLFPNAAEETSTDEPSRETDSDPIDSFDDENVDWVEGWQP